MDIQCFSSAERIQNRQMQRLYLFCLTKWSQLGITECEVNINNLLRTDSLMEDFLLALNIF